MVFAGKIFAISCLALTLPVAHATPTTADVKRYLENSLTGCKNVKAVEIKKTNGYWQGADYRVEFSYRIKLKNPQDIKDFSVKWQEDHRRYTELTRDYKLMVAHIEKESKLESEINSLEILLMPGELESEYSLKGKNITEDEIKAHIEEIKARIEEKKAELKILSARSRNSSLYSQTPIVIGDYLIQNCKYSFAALQLTGVAFQYLPYQAALAQNNPSLLEMEHNFFVLMRKTEKGWRSLDGR